MTAPTCGFGEGLPERACTSARSIHRSSSDGAAATATAAASTGGGGGGGSAAAGATCGGGGVLPPGAFAAPARDGLGGLLLSVMTEECPSRARADRSRSSARRCLGSGDTRSQSERRRRDRARGDGP